MSDPKKSHHEDTKTRRNPLRLFASSCLCGEQDACAPTQPGKDFFRTNDKWQMNDDKWKSEVRTANCDLSFFIIFHWSFIICQIGITGRERVAMAKIDEF